MIQKIYTTFISFAFAALTLSSCSDWLDLYPSDEIKEEYLFSSGDGFRTATNVFTGKWLLSICMAVILLGEF